jgi:hypothetical protein
MHYGTITSLPPEMVLSKAQVFFGELGLKSTRKTPNHLSMEGQGGSVIMDLSIGAETEVDIETNKFDSHVKQFLQRIG